jgi:hypothetical protein
MKKIILILFLSIAISNGIHQISKLYLVPEKQVENNSITFINKTDDHRYDKFWKGSLKIAKAQSGFDFGLIYLPELPLKKSVEEYASKMFLDLEIGKKNKGHGMLFVLVEKPRTLKIEVSYALEGLFPDIMVHRFEDAAKTFFSSGHKGDFITEILVTMSFYIKEKMENAHLADYVVPALDTDFSTLSKRFTSGGAGITSRGYAKTLEEGLQEITSISSLDNEQLNLSKDSKQTVETYLESLHKGVGSPNISFLTTGSKLFRMEYLRNSAYQKRTFEFYQKALPYKIYENENKTLAAAIFKKGHPVWPIYLRKNQAGEWLIDEAKSWAYTHLFENGTDAFQKSEDHPFIFAWKEAKRYSQENVLYFKRVKTPELNPNLTNLFDQIYHLENNIKNEPNSVNNYIALADSLYFEAYWISAAKDLYLKALSIDSSRDDLRWRLIDLGLNLGEIDICLTTLADLMRRHPDDINIMRRYNELANFYGTDSIIKTQNTVFSRSIANKEISDQFSFEEKTGISIQKAYDLVPHRRAPFSSEKSNISSDNKFFLDKVFKLSDQALVLKMSYLSSLQKGQLPACSMDCYTKVLTALESLLKQNPSERSAKMIYEAIVDQEKFFNNQMEKLKKDPSFRLDVKNELSQNPLIQSSSAKLREAYSLLMSTYSNENAGNKDAFFQYLCALDFL